MTKKHHNLPLLPGLFASSLLASLAVNSAHAAIDVYDSRTGELLKSTNDNELVIPYKDRLSVKIVPRNSSDKTRLEPHNTDCGVHMQSDNSAPYVFSLEPMSADSTCKFRVIAWLEPWRWTWHEDFTIAFSDDDILDPVDPVEPVEPVEPEPVAEVDGDKVVWTIGTSGQSDYMVGPVVPRSNHGNRIYCTISHFSYDDPIIYPSQPGEAHLHMFYGNTETNAFSTPSSIPSSGKSSCLGGTNYRSGIWTPALFNDRDEVVIPDSVYIYYKTFMHQDYNNLQVIPQGIEMLASLETMNAYSGYIRSNRGLKDGKPTMTMVLNFPSCVATENGQRTGSPILSYKDMPGALSTEVNSHVAYPGGPNSNEAGCPASHPYRFATPILILNYDEVAVGSNPYLSSDMMADAPALSTLHADYIFGMDPQVNQQVLRCVQESRNCNFGSVGALPERFLSEDGTQLYQYNILRPEVDRTPFGDTLKPMKMH